MQWAFIVSLVKSTSLDVITFVYVRRSLPPVPALYKANVGHRTKSKLSFFSSSSFVYTIYHSHHLTAHEVESGNQLVIDVERSYEKKAEQR